MLCVVLCGLIHVGLMLSLLGSRKSIRSSRLAKMCFLRSQREEEGLEVGATVILESFYFSYVWLGGGRSMCTHARYSVWRSEGNR